MKCMTLYFSPVLPPVYLYVNLQAAAYESCKPLAAWVRDLVRRVEFFSGWAELITTRYENRLKTTASGRRLSEASSEPERDQPRAFWLSGFYFPQGKMTRSLEPFFSS